MNGTDCLAIKEVSGERTTAVGKSTRKNVLRRNVVLEELNARKPCLDHIFTRLLIRSRKVFSLSYPTLMRFRPQMRRLFSSEIRAKLFSVCLSDSSSQKLRDTWSTGLKALRIHHSDEEIDTDIYRPIAGLVKDSVAQFSDPEGTLAKTEKDVFKFAAKIGEFAAFFAGEANEESEETCVEENAKSVMLRIFPSAEESDGGKIGSPLAMP